MVSLVFYLTAHDVFWIGVAVLSVKFISIHYSLLEKYFKGHLKFEKPTNWFGLSGKFVAPIAV